MRQSWQIILEMTRHDPAAVFGFVFLGASGVLSFHILLKLNKAGYPLGANAFGGTIPVPSRGLRKTGKIERRSDEVASLLEDGSRIIRAGPDRGGIAVKRYTLFVAALMLAAPLSAQTQMEVCPEHVEAPSYPPIARTANITGTVPVKVVLDASGRVTSAEIAKENTKQEVLWSQTLDNIKTWTFDAPPHAPYEMVVTYDYEFDPSLPSNTGQNPITKVTFDLPNRVSIFMNARSIDTSKAMNRK